MKTTNISTDLASLSKLIEKVQMGEQVIITKAGKPVALLVPYKENSSPREPGGSWEGKVWMAEDFDETPQEVIESFYGNRES
ncbi:MAG: type II toxin-antitoxin system prevent-host-death family antitoxin [Prochloron sp. SP5CPC1]|nr:type II toxin-antitoxin system prevent-host-death family antitoxin [Candidatus Paraprochloron terpiosi SP5CPC1]